MPLVYAQTQHILSCPYLVAYNPWPGIIDQVLKGQPNHILVSDPTHTKNNTLLFENLLSRCHAT